METEGVYSYQVAYVLQEDLTFTRLTPEVIDFVRDELGLPRPSASWDPSGRQIEFSARVRLTAEAIEDGKNRLGAFARAVAAEQSRLMEDLVRLQEPLMVRPRPVDTAGIGSILKEIYEWPVAESLSASNPIYDQFARRVTWEDVERSDEPFWVGVPGEIIKYSPIPPGTVVTVPPVMVQLTPARVYFDAD
jgi:hypothetical protein